MTHAEELKSIGLKATAPRLKILELFQNGGMRHMTAEDVYRALMQEEIDVGLATVYRVLTQFEQAGLLTRHHFEADRSVFELNEGRHHDHLVCMQCGRVEEFFDPLIEKRQAEIASERGFAIREHVLCLYVDCLRENCDRRNPAPSGGAAGAVPPRRSE